MVSCAVDNEVELVDSERDDHNLVAATITIQLGDEEPRAIKPETTQSCVCATPRLDRDKMSDPYLCDRFECWMAYFQKPDNGTVDVHLDALRYHAKMGAQSCSEGDLFYVLDVSN